MVFAVNSIAQANPDELVIEAQVDGPSALHIKPNSMYWENGVNAKPGRANLLNESTYVNGIAWLPKWKKQKESRGEDKTLPYNVGLGSTNLALELLSVTMEKGQVGVDKRSAIVEKQEHGEYIITIPDAESGERWYKFVVRKK